MHDLEVESGESYPIHALWWDSDLFEYGIDEESDWWEAGEPLTEDV